MYEFDFSSAKSEIQPRHDPARIAYFERLIRRYHQEVSMREIVGSARIVRSELHLGPLLLQWHQEIVDAVTSDVQGTHDRFIHRGPPSVRAFNSWLMRYPA